MVSLYSYRFRCSASIAPFGTNQFPGSQSLAQFVSSAYLNGSFLLRIIKDSLRSSFSRLYSCLFAAFLSVLWIRTVSLCESFSGQFFNVFPMLSSPFECRSV